MLGRGLEGLELEADGTKAGRSTSKRNRLVHGETGCTNAHLEPAFAHGEIGSKEPSPYTTKLCCRFLRWPNVDTTPSIFAKSSTYWSRRIA